MRRRFGAHSIGIARKRTRGRATDRLALVFYVERKGQGPEAVPPTIPFTPAGGETVELLTDVVETPQVEFE